MTSKKVSIRNDPLAWVDDDESRVEASVTDEDGPVTTETARDVAQQDEDNSGLDTVSAQPDGGAPKSPEETGSDKGISTLTGGQETMKLTKALNIAQVAELHEEFGKLLVEGHPMEVDASAVETVDTAALQLLLAVVREAEKKDVAFSWRSPSAAFSDSASLLGLTGELKLPANG